MHTEEIGKSICFHLINIAFLRFSSKSKYTNIISPFTRLYLVTEGSGYLVLEGNMIKLEKGYIYLIPSYMPCTYFFEENLAHYYIHFSMEIPSFPNIYSLYSIKNKVKATDLDKILINRCVELNPGFELPHHDPKIYQNKPWINKKLSFDSIGHYLETTGIIKQLISRFTGQELTNQIGNLSDHNLQHVLTYIRKNLTNDLSVSELADIACISRDHFTRTFKSITGMPPSEFIIQKRIEKAKMFLLTTNDSLTEIISQTGFKTTAYFCRIFKKYTSYTPLEFRMKRG